MVPCQSSTVKVRKIFFNSAKNIFIVRMHVLLQVHQLPALTFRPVASWSDINNTEEHPGNPEITSCEDKSIRGSINVRELKKKGGEKEEEKELS